MATTAVVVVAASPPNVISGYKNRKRENEIVLGKVS